MKLICKDQAEAEELLKQRQETKTYRDLEIIHISRKKLFNK